MANHTKPLLAESLKALLTKKPLDKITIKEIVESCGVNRQTFYYNFRDIYDLMEWILLEDTRKIMESGKACGDWIKEISLLFEYLQNHSGRTLNAFHSMSRASLRRCVKSVFVPIMEDVIGRQPGAGALSGENKTFLVDVYVLLLTGIVIEWLEDGMRSDYLFQLERLRKVLNCTVGHLVEEFTD